MRPRGTSRKPPIGVAAGFGVDFGGGVPFTLAGGGAAELEFELDDELAFELAGLLAAALFVFVSFDT